MGRLIAGRWVRPRNDCCGRLIHDRRHDCRLGWKLAVQLTERETGSVSASVARRNLLANGYRPHMPEQHSIILPRMLVGRLAIFDTILFRLVSYAVRMADSKYSELILKDDGLD